MSRSEWRVWNLFLSYLFPSNYLPSPPHLTPHPSFPPVGCRLANAVPKCQGWTVELLNPANCTLIFWSCTQLVSWYRNQRSEHSHVQRVASSPSDERRLTTKMCVCIASISCCTPLSHPLSLFCHKWSLLAYSDFPVPLKSRWLSLPAPNLHTHTTLIQPTTEYNPGKDICLFLMILFINCRPLSLSLVTFLPLPASLSNILWPAWTNACCCVMLCV